MSAFFDLQTNQDGRDQQALADYALTLQSALVALDYDTRRDFVVEADGQGFRCRLHATARFLGRGRPDPAFRLRGLQLDQPAYFVGQKATVSFTVTRDAYVYLLDVDENEDVTLLLPNREVDKPVLAKAGVKVNIARTGAAAAGTN